MRVALIGLALLAVASAMYIPADEAHDRPEQKRFIDSWHLGDYLPSQEDLDKLKEKLNDAKDKLKDKLEDAKDTLKDQLANAKDKLSDAKDTLGDKLSNAKDVLGDKLSDAKDSLKDKLESAKEKLSDVMEKADQKRFIDSWHLPDILPSKEDIDKLKGKITDTIKKAKDKITGTIGDAKDKIDDATGTLEGVFPDIDEAAKGEIEGLFKTVEDQTTVVTKFGDLFSSLTDESTIIDKFSKLYKFQDEEGKSMGVVEWISAAVLKVEEFYEGVIPAGIKEKIMEVKEAAADKSDSKRLPSAILVLFCELLQQVGLLVINYAIGLPAV